MKIGFVIRRRRQALGWSLERLASHVDDYDAGNLSRFERGLQNIDPDKLKDLADALGTNVSALYAEAEEINETPAAYIGRTHGMTNSNRNTSPSPIHVVPLLRWDQVREWVRNKDIEGDIAMAYTTQKPMPSVAALKVEGDSMLPRFRHNDHIFIDPEQTAKNGDFVIAIGEDGTELLRQLEISGGRRYLKPLNPAYAVERCSEILAKVVRREAGEDL